MENDNVQELNDEFSQLDIKSGKTKKKPKKEKMHNYKYLIIVDFEATCWDQSARQNVKQEIIEFPACLLNLGTGVVEAEFQHYCKPVENPILSDYCKALTGIQQDWVEDGIDLEDCIQKFSQWIKSLIQQKNLILPKTNKHNLEGNCVLVSWSNWDFMVCLQRECTRKNIRKPSYFNQWMDLKEIFTEHMKKKEKFTFHDALAQKQIVFEGNPHCGLDDARNCARLAYKMHLDKCFFRITKDLNQHELNRRF